jgi:hypothetical protein
MHDLNERKNRNSHEMSHQSATVRNEIDEAKTLRSSFNIKLILSKHHVDRTHRFTGKRRIRILSFIERKLPF